MYDYLIVAFLSGAFGALFTSVYYARKIQKIVRILPPDYRAKVRAILRGEQ